MPQDKEDVQPPTESCKAFCSVSPVCQLAKRWRGVPSPFPKEDKCVQVGFHGQRHSTRCSYASLLGGTPSSLFCQNERRKKQWKGPSSGAALSPSFSVAEAGSPGPLLWHMPPGSSSAAPGSSPAPSSCAGASRPGQQPRPVHGQGEGKRQQRCGSFQACRQQVQVFLCKV